MARALRHAFTLTEILVVLGILVILAAIAFPLAKRTIDSGNQTKCISNLRQISVASASYSADNAGQWPRNSTGKSVYITDIIPYFGQIPHTKTGNFKQSPLFCPATTPQSDRRDGTYNFSGFYVLPYKNPITQETGSYALSYAQNTYAQESTIIPRRISVENPSKMMLYMDYSDHYLVSLGGVKAANRRETLMNRHAGKVNVAYVDGSLGSISYDDIPTEGDPAASRPNASSMFWTGRALQ